MFQIRKAERRQAKLRLALTGVSGSGKSMGAINLAAGMGGKFILIDTEHTSADLFAHLADFDVINLDKPFTPEKYVQAINYCEERGYETIIIDSLSHAWAGEGGVLDMHDIATEASSSKNSYMAWKEVTPWQNKLVNTIIQSKAHLITTLRVKTHYDVVDVQGKKKPIKIGLAPIQREGLEYEFTTVLNMEKDSHLYSSSKDRTQLFEGKHEKISKETGRKVIEWLNNGKSFQEVEREEVGKLTQDLESCSTIESLRATFRMARDKYPSHCDNFLKICNERSQLLSPVGEMSS